MYTWEKEFITTFSLGENEMTYGFDDSRIYVIDNTSEEKLCYIEKADVLTNQAQIHKLDNE